MSIPGERTPSDPDRAPDERARRIRLEIPVEIRTGTGSFAGVTKNICAGGVFVAMFRSFSVGERVAVWLRMPGDAEPVEALAEVRWSRPFQELPDRPAGLGLRFLDPPPRIIRVTRYGR
jgi:uncharacterized protein (TIGR02266 family)